MIKVSPITPERIELFFGIFITVFSIIAISRVSSLEEKSRVHLYIYLNSGCEASPILSLHINPSKHKILGYIKFPPYNSNECREATLFSSEQIFSATQELRDKKNVPISVVKSKEPLVYGVYYKYEPLAPAQFVINNMNMSSSVQNSIKVDASEFDLRNVGDWPKEIKNLVAAAKIRNEVRLEIGFLGKYETSYDPTPDNCYVIEEAGDIRPSEECKFTRPKTGDLIKIKAEPSNLKETRDCYLTLFGLLASSGFGLVFDAFRRYASRLVASR